VGRAGRLRRCSTFSPLQVTRGLEGISRANSTSLEDEAQPVDMAPVSSGAVALEGKRIIEVENLPGGCNAHG
jgi:hypothetical protein